MVPFDVKRLLTMVPLDEICVQKYIPKYGNTDPFNRTWELSSNYSIAHTEIEVMKNWLCRKKKLIRTLSLLSLIHI